MAPMNIRSTARSHIPIARRKGVSGAVTAACVTALPLNNGFSVHLYRRTFTIRQLRVTHKDNRPTEGQRRASHRVSNIFSLVKLTTELMTLRLTRGKYSHLPAKHSRRQCMKWLFRLLFARLQVAFRDSASFNTRLCGDFVAETFKTLRHFCDVNIFTFPASLRYNNLHCCLKLARICNYEKVIQHSLSGKVKIAICQRRLFW